MRQAIIDFQTQHSSRGQHAGLVLQRYHWRNATGEDGSPEERRNILRAAIAAADALKSSDSLYQTHFTKPHSSAGQRYFQRTRRPLIYKPKAG